MNTILTNDWNINAEQLWETGVTYFPIADTLVQPARVGFKDFFARRNKLGDHDKWCLTRPGEAEPDLGLIQRTGKNHDIKWFFHHDSSLAVQSVQHQLMENYYDAYFLRENQELLSYINCAGYYLVKALETTYGIPCSENYWQCQTTAVPYCATTLRSLFYPAGPDQTGAKAHIDRSFVTIHLGDEGGHLQMLVDGQWQNISPPAGYAVAFFGVKVLWVTDGLQEPLRHRSVTFPDQDRFAFVHFGHTKLDSYAVTDADKAQKFYNEHVRHAA